MRHKEMICPFKLTSLLGSTEQPMEKNRLIQVNVSHDHHTHSAQQSDRSAQAEEHGCLAVDVHLQYSGSVLQIEDGARLRHLTHLGYGLEQGNKCRARTSYAFCEFL
ncbi:hypothetical protein BSZ21_01280 [Bradyrhizobium canariense]|nr:hypothetical protein BSZ21_01280 [Bradyrhizobium canariense]